MSILFRFMLSAFMICVFPAKTAMAKKPLPLVAITQIVAHPSLDKIRLGIIDELYDNGYKPDQDYVLQYENAQGNITIAAQIAQKFVAQQPALVIAIATPSAQTVAQAIKSTDIPLVFSGVTDPVGAKLVKDLYKTENNITGTLDQPQAEQQLTGMLAFVPDMRILGVLFNPSETNSLKQIEMVKQAVKLHNISLVEFPAPRTSDVGAAAKAACNQVDAIFIPNDNSIISALNAVLQTSDQQKIPVFTSDPESVERGALSAHANDQYLVGRETGKIAVEILRGKQAKDIPVRIVTHFKTYTNKKKAEFLGFASRNP